MGILYVNENIKINPFIHGGSQERNMRAGTENLYGIVGFAKALELATAGFEEDRRYINSIRLYMMDELLKHIRMCPLTAIPFGNSLYTVLSVGFPKQKKAKCCSSALI